MSTTDQPTDPRRCYHTSVLFAQLAADPQFRAFMEPLPVESAPLTGVSVGDLLRVGSEGSSDVYLVPVVYAGPELVRATLRQKGQPFIELFLRAVDGREKDTRKAFRAGARPATPEEIALCGGLPGQLLTTRQYWATVARSQGAVIPEGTAGRDLALLLIEQVGENVDMFGAYADAMLTDEQRPTLLTDAVAALDAYAAECEAAIQAGTIGDEDYARYMACNPANLAHDFRERAVEGDGEILARPRPLPISTEQPVP